MSTPLPTVSDRQLLAAFMEVKNRALKEHEPEATEALLVYGAVARLVAAIESKETFRDDYASSHV